MRKILLFSLIFSNIYAQKAFKSQLLNNWIKDEITMADGSRVYNNRLSNISMGLNFVSRDSVYLTVNGTMHKIYYSLKDTTLNVDGMTFQITKLTEIDLNMVYTPEEGTEALMYHFTPKNLYGLTFTPNRYTSKKGELVYKNFPGKLEPLFLDKNYSAMDFIANKFAFPEYKKGGFVVRFVVTKAGEVMGAKVISSSNEHYNQKLVEAVQKTAGKWLPATYLGEKVNTEIQYDFNLGYTEDNQILATDSLKFSDMYFGYGNDFFEEKSYRQAEGYYTKAIGYNPLNVQAYYQRAACNIFLRRKEEACKDYKQLVFLDQQKGKSLFEKFCK